jgi:sugar phosphate permease
VLGLGYFWDVHVLWYFIFTQVVFGIFQATGWPSVVAVVGKWVHRSRCVPRTHCALLTAMWLAQHVLSIRPANCRLSFSPPHLRLDTAVA